MSFTDEVLDPRRTTRHDIDPFRDRADAIIRGDLILVDVSAYRHDLEGGTLLWCEFLYDAPGSASVYPYKAAIKGAGTGQWKASEIVAWARPVELHRRLIELPTLY